MEHPSQSGLFVDLLPDRAYWGVKIANRGVKIGKWGVSAVIPLQYCTYQRKRWL